jgi:hypothetical protein
MARSTRSIFLRSCLVGAKRLAGMALQELPTCRFVEQPTANCALFVSEGRFPRIFGAPVNAVAKIK